MRKIFVTLGIVAGTPVLITGLLILFTTSFFIVIAAPPPCFAPTSYHIARMQMIVWRGEMEWDAEIEKAFSHLEKCSANKRELAARFLENRDGTLVSLGMDLVVKESIENGNRLLANHLDDKRWNFHLTQNKEYARLLLAIWKIKKDIPLSVQEVEEIQQWPNEYFDTFGVLAPRIRI